MLIIINDEEWGHEWKQRDRRSGKSGAFIPFDLPFLGTSRHRRDPAKKVCLTSILAFK